MAKAAPYSDQKSWSNTYLTNPDLVEALGPFDMDVCCPPTMPWKTAEKMLHEDQYDGLTEVWKGRVWMNPPYRGVLKWARKFVDNKNGICLLNGRSPETRASQLILQNADSMFLLNHRLVFHQESGEPFNGKWFPSLLIGMSEYDSLCLKRLPDQGFNGVFLRVET